MQLFIGKHPEQCVCCKSQAASVNTHIGSLVSSVAKVEQAPAPAPQHLGKSSELLSVCVPHRSQNILASITCVKHFGVLVLGEELILQCDVRGVWNVHHDPAQMCLYLTDFSRIIHNITR